MRGRSAPWIGETVGVLLTISTTHRPATDLGFLLHKHPDRVQEFPQSFGTATVFYPEATEGRCTVALVLEVDAVELARTWAKDLPDFTLAHYVNDRPYAASSLLAVALGRVFGTARSGRCASHQDLADTAIPLQIEVPVLPCRGGPQVAHQFFAPLGWTVRADPIVLDEAFPEWGDSRYVRLRLDGTVRLADALSQLFVMLPVLDESKHYWQGADEVDKLLRSGEGWLAGHPSRDLIARRYLGRNRHLARAAIDRLAALDDRPEEAAPSEPTAEEVTPGKRTPLNVQRHEAVERALVELGATSVIDLGCGSGQLLARLLKMRSVDRIAGSDVSTRQLQYAARRLHVDDMTERQASRLSLFQGALTYEDARYAGYDAAVLMEVIEHLDPSRIGALEHVVFGAASPGAVIVTTPNSEYNALYEGLKGMRHPDHRFEWTRAEFADWCAGVASTHGYAVERRGIGEVDPTLGSPTQMAIFTRTEG